MSDLFVGTHWNHELFLKWTTRDGLRERFTSILMRLYDHERGLDAGRFARFTQDQPQEFAIQLTLNHEETAFWYQLPIWVEWIAEHHEGAWSLEIQMDHVQQGRFTFSFDDVGVAMMFKLLFA